MFTRFLVFLTLSFSSLFASQADFGKYIHYQENERNLIGYIAIEKDRAIDQSTYLYVKFALEHYKKIGARFILLNLNTPGGEVFAAMKIADLLRKIDIDDHIPVVAFIDDWAISAGAMLAYSSRFIAIVKSSSMGAAEPVLSGAEGKMETASEKINSALRAEFANLASFYDRNPLIAEAMVDKDLILVYRKGEVVRLESEDQIRNSDEIITRKGKLLTLNAEQLQYYGIADVMVPPHSVAPISEEERKAAEWPAHKSLLFQDPFFAQIPNATIVSYTDWKIDFFAFLSQPMIASILFMGLIIGGYIEISHPGFGIPGIAAISCLALILLSHFAVETINWLELIILAVGVILLLVELLILPGFGVAGILGTILTLVGLFALMLPDIGSVQFSWNFADLNLATIAFLERLEYICFAFLLSVIVISVLAFFFSPRLLKMSRLVLNGEQTGYTAGPDINTLPAIGSCGLVHASLRPGGKVIIDGKIYDALSTGSFIEAQEKITVLRIDGNQIIVGKI